MSEQRIVVIGAAGEMASTGIRLLAEHRPDLGFELYDLDEGRLATLAEQLPGRRAKTEMVDLFDEDRLRAAIGGASLVILGAGPYMRTAPPVMRACIEVGVDYLDFDDDIESTQEALLLAEGARAAEVAMMIGCGASPGLSNVMAVDASSRLDQVETIDVAFLVGDEGAKPFGAAVLEHLFHVVAGECLSWRDGAHVTVEAGRDSEVFPLGDDVGDYRLYETAHPEVITLPLRYPEARSIRVMGGLHPQPANGVAQGVARALHRGKFPVAEAVAWFQAVLQDQPAPLRGWRHALAGMIGQVASRQCSVADLARYLWMGVRKEHPEFRGALLVKVTGTRDGSPSSVVLRTATGGPRTVLAPSMAVVTGTCVAAFTILALGQKGSHRGVLMPEDWVTPDDLYTALEKLGVPRSEIIDRVILD